MTLEHPDQPLDAFLGAPRPTVWSRYGKWIAIGIGVLLLGLLVKSCAAGKPPAEFQTSPVVRGDLAVSVTAVGNLAPTNQIVVGSQISGLITKVLVDVNDRVVAGQPIALIDPRRLDDALKIDAAAVAQQRANVAQMRATLDESTAQLARYKEVSRLSGGRVPAATEMATQEATVMRSEANLRAAEAQVRSALAQLSSDETQRGYAVIRSPVAGVILSRQIDPGQTVAAAFSTPTLFTIAEDLARMKLDVAIDEADVGQVRAGQTANFTVDAFPGRNFPATIKRVNLGSTATTTASSGSTTSSTSAASSNVVSYTASLIVANADFTLRPGMTATAMIGVQNAHDVLLVPNAALRFVPTDPNAQDTGGAIKLGPPPDSGKKGVKVREIGAGSHQTLYVLGDDGKPSPIEAVTGATDGRLTVVLSDKLRPGMKVITGRKAASP